MPHWNSFSDPCATLASGDALRAEFRTQLASALNQLPDEQRDVFIMREVSGLKFREIADILNISENTVKSRMRYALQALRTSLATYNDFNIDADEQNDALGTSRRSL